MVLNRKILIIIIILFIIIVFCKNNGGNNLNNEVKNNDQNIIKIDNPLETIKIEYDLGNVKPLDIKTLKYKLFNNTGEVLIVYYAETSCGCAIATLEDKNKSQKFADKSHGEVAYMEIENNESLDINIELDFSEESVGKDSKIVNVFNDYMDLISKIEIFYFVEG